MNIGVIGSGHIGGALAQKWASTEHHVVVGSRHAEAKRSSPDALHLRGLHYDSVDAAVRHGDAVLLAIPAAAVGAFLNTHGRDLNGKIVIDATNNVVAEDMSAVEEILSAAPQARVFRAFNCLGWENFANPVFGSERADLFYCGVDDEDARRKVEHLVSDTGLRPILVGELDQTRVIDGVTRLWFALTSGRGMGRHLAFRVLHD